MMMSCRDYARLVADGSVEDLPLLRRIDARVHHFLCARCRRYAQQMDQLRIAVRHILGSERPGDAAVSAEIEERVIDDLRRRRHT